MHSGVRKKYPHVRKMRNKYYYNLYANGKLKWYGGYDTGLLASEAYTEAKKDKAEKNTVADVVNKYYDLWGNSHLRKNTLRNDSMSVRNYILPMLGKIKITELTKMKILEFQNQVKEMTGDETHPGIVQTNHTLIVLSKIFNWAINKAEIMVKNPVKGIDKLPLPKRDYPILQPDQLFTLLDDLTGKNKYIVAMGALAGARLGETFGFQWKDIDFENRKITFDRQIIRMGLTTDLKTPTSHATLDILPNLLDLLKEWKSKSRDGAMWIFENTEQSFMRPDHWSNREWIKKIRSQYDFLKSFRYHDLRHTFASLLIKKGLSPKEVQHLMRHAKLAMTMDLYVDLFPDDVKQKVDAIRFDK